MTTSRTLATWALLLVVAAATPPTTAQDNLELGKMWTFENVPKDYFEREHGFELTQEWLDAMRLASIRFGGGCSSSFVSPRGLIMTNHHCVRSHVAKASPDDEDWVKDGFVAHSPAEEIPLEGLSVQQLVKMVDVTKRMNAGIRDDDGVDAIAKKLEANEEAILEQARKDHEDLTAQVVKLFQGGQYQLYFYRVYTDIRLVCSPHLQTSHFGGDHDNFTYPRYGIDFSFCRAWDGDKPLDTSRHYFKFNPDGPAEGESVFVTGNPGSTGRLDTYAQLGYLRDVQYPLALEIIDMRLEAWRAEAATGAEAEKKVRTSILRYENGQKAYTGYLSGLLDPELMRRKKQAELALRAEIAADAQLERKYGTAWDELAKIAEARRQAEPRRRLHDHLGIPAVRRALAVLEAVGEETADEARDEAVERAIAIDPEQKPWDRRATLRQLDMVRRWLPEDDAYRRALDVGDDPAAALDRITSSSRLDDEDVLRRLVGGGSDAAEESADGAVVLARLLRRLRRESRELREALRSDEEVHKARVGQALFSVYGTSVSPDATFTLRLSDGKVKGFPCNGTIAPPWTSFYGLYARNTEFGNRHPFDLPDVWRERRDRIDMTRPVDFVATNDIIGGNSGSPVVNRDLEIVGLVFDGNIEMLPNRFLYRDDVPRSVSVHSAAILEALRKIYDADELVSELLAEN